MKPTDAQGQRNAALLDMARHHMKLRNDAALARAIWASAPHISKVRNGLLPVGPQMLLNIHEASIERNCVITVAELRSYVPRSVKPGKNAEQ